jgi:hypothetical protein
MRLARWQQKLILEDLEVAFENRLTVMEHASHGV